MAKQADILLNFSNYVAGVRESPKGNEQSTEKHSGGDRNTSEPDQKIKHRIRYQTPSIGNIRLYSSQDRPSHDQVESLLKKEILLTKEIRKLRIEALYSIETQKKTIYREIQKKTRYRSQRDNMAVELIRREKDGRVVLKWLGDVMCNLTSLTRALDAQGISFDKQWSQGEDELEAIRPRDEPRTKSQTLIKLARDVGMNLTDIFWKGWEKEKNINKTEWNTIQSMYLDTGFSVIFSIGGHIMSLQEVESNGLRVDDPYGRVLLKPSSAVKVVEEKTRGGRKFLVDKFSIEDPNKYWTYSNQSKNERFGPNGWRGNDHLIPWSQALNHRMHWVMVIGGTEIAS